MYHILVTLLLCTFVIASKKNMSILILWPVWWALKFITFISMQDIVLTKLVEWNFEVQVTSIFGESTHYVILGHWVSYFILVEFYISYSTITRTGHQFQARLTPKKKNNYKIFSISSDFWIFSRYESYKNNKVKVLASLNPIKHYCTVIKKEKQCNGRKLSNSPSN